MQRKRAYQTVMKIKKASFQQGKKTISANKNGRAKPGDTHMPGGTIVGNNGLDVTFTAQPGWVIKEETFTTPEGWLAKRVHLEKVL